MEFLSKNKRKLFFSLTSLVTIVALLLLATGSSILTMAIDQRARIPFGTIITWAGLTSFPLTIYWGIKELRKPTIVFNRILSGFLIAVIAFGILWLPISFLLAGNLSFSFAEKESFQGGQMAMKLFWILSFSIF